MIDSKYLDYSILDRPEVRTALFHPRAEAANIGNIHQGIDLLIPVAGDIGVGARFHMLDKGSPNILFFHGNGEIVSDYDEMGPMYNQLGINFLPVDYRGYGRSSGEPSVSSMMQDCHTIFTFVRQWLQDKGHKGPLIVMGRSLGSASALEIAWAHPQEMDALIIESGFAWAGPLLRLLGIDADALGFIEEKGFKNTDKIKTFTKPTLIIHAENDHIIPFSDGQSLFDASPASVKRLIRVPGANHNDILFRGLSAYMAGIRNLVQGLIND